MTSSNWIGLVLTAVIIIAGTSIYLYFRQKFSRMDGVEGFIIERGKPLRRMVFDWNAEFERLEKELLDIAKL